jgi:hypothetical protein
MNSPNIRGHETSVAPMDGVLLGNSLLVSLVPYASSQVIEFWRRRPAGNAKPMLLVCLRRLKVKQKGGRALVPLHEAQRFESIICLWTLLTLCLLAGESQYQLPDVSPEGYTVDSGSLDRARLEVTSPGERFTAGLHKREEDADHLGWK